MFCITLNLDPNTGAFDCEQKQHPKVVISHTFPVFRQWRKQSHCHLSGLQPLLPLLLGFLGLYRSGWRVCSYKPQNIFQGCEHLCPTFICPPHQSFALNYMAKLGECFVFLSLQPAIEIMWLTGRQIRVFCPFGHCKTHLCSSAF